MFLLPSLCRSLGTKKARELTHTELDVPYGAGGGEKVDYYMPTSYSMDVSLVMYIHGGYWQCLSKEESGFMAITMMHKEVVVAAVDYDIAPKGNMDWIVSQIRRAVVAAMEFTCFRVPLYLCGHSAGAHLAAMVLSTDWSQYSITPKINGALLVSGIYDLLPILSTDVNELVKMTEEVALRNSPMKLLPELKQSSPNCNIVVAVAEHDSPEFRKQSEEYYRDLKELGLNVLLEDVPNTDHFNIIEQLTDGEFHLTQVEHQHHHCHSAK
ncbi:hypothetical protein NHX12_017796 [Muraenolepis orangiensis]|uniref:BD-FAE-like domain-containing protein n=1 Tax=Muraenolepis orangiensis TaxID=630683 RepID=A0A9Q0F023_9TELE|nr:hypothetical protein NHX12_017796 [Muraenolepis orangiensis]